MLIIKVWCLPENRTEENLREFHRKIVAAVVSIEDFEVKGQNDLVCLFPSDLMKYGLGEEIIVEATCFSGTRDAWQRLAENLGKVVQTHFPSAKVQCHVQVSNEMNGFWQSY